MESVRIAILSTYDRTCAFMDNSAPDALHFYDDELHSYLSGTASTFQFTTFSKHKDAGYLVEGNKLSFRYRNKDYYFNIMKVRRTEYTVEVEAYSLMLELLNDELGAYKASQAMTFAEYLEAFDMDGVVGLNLNEVSGKSITNEWTGTSTILARILSLATVFNAEAELVPELNKDYSLKRLVLNVYKENDGECQGIGRRRADITLRYGVNIEGITKTVDISDLYTAIRPEGKDGLSLATLDKTEEDGDGNAEFTSPAGDPCIYAVQARDRFPSNVLKNGNGRYIMKTWSYDTDNVNTLYGQSLAELKKLCEPSVKYEVDGYFDTDIGDTVRIADEEFVPPLYLDARVTEQIRSFTDPTRNKTTFDNFRELQSELSGDILSRMEKLIAENKLYACSIVSDNGIIFKNSEGTTTLTADVRDGAVDVTDDFTILWYKDGKALAQAGSITVSAMDVEGKSVYCFKAIDGNGAIRGICEVTVVSVTDGKDGLDGEDGKSAYQIAVEEGEFTGTLPEWLQSLKGDPGSPGENGTMLSGTCQTEAAVEVKEIVCEKAISLYAGLTILVEFSTANTAAEPTLNVNALGARPIYLNGAFAAPYNLFLWGAGAKIQFTYNGACWIPVGHPCAYYGTSSTEATVAAKVSDIAGIVICKGTTVGVRFTYANSAASPSLNLSSVGAKAVYTQGVAYAYWQAGATVSFTFDGMAWRVSSEPVYAPEVIVGNAAGRNVHIGSNSVDIRNGGTTQASFGGSLINIGAYAEASANNNKATINFFEQLGSILFEIGGTRDAMSLISGLLKLSAYNASISVGDGDIYFQIYISDVGETKRIFLSQIIEVIEALTYNADKHIIVGKWGASWNLSTSSTNIGSKKPAVNNDYYNSTTGANATVTIKQAGLYYVYLYAQGTAGSGASTAIVADVVANKTIIDDEYVLYGQQYTYNSISTNLNAGRIIYIPANTVLTARIRKTTSAAATTTGSSYMEITKIL